MLQQTQVKTVIPYWERWMRAMPDVRSLARARPGRVLKLWEGLGYYSRARRLQKAARIIVTEHAGRFPETFDDVLALPGIGRYTAGAICSIAFNQPTAILDGNVIRVLTRLFGIRQNPRAKTGSTKLWQLAQQLVTQADITSGDCSGLNQSLMELGATVCTPRQPDCTACPVRSRCIAYHDDLTGKLPNLGRRPAATARRFIAIAARCDGHYLVRRRPHGVVNAGLWEFPNVEAASASDDPRTLAESLLGAPVRLLERLCQIKHTITRYRMTLDVFEGELTVRSGRDRHHRWCLPGELVKLAFPSAHQRIVRRLLEKEAESASHR